MIVLEVKFKSNVNGVIGERAAPGNVDPAVIGETQMCSQRNLLQTEVHSRVCTFTL